MKIAFLVEYFYPIYFGGSEVSAELFAKYLSKKCEIIIICPKLNPHSVEFEKKDGYKIFRYIFPKHIVRHKPFSQFWHNSLILSLWRAFWIIKIAKREKIDIIHVQEKYLLIASMIAKFFLHKPLIITIRDYQLLCPMGFCIKKERRYKRCNLVVFFREDIPYYFNYYLCRGTARRAPTSWFVIPAKAGIQILFLLRARFIAWVYRFCLRFCDQIIFISEKQKQIYEANGIKHGKVIYNIAEFNNNKIKNETQKDIDILFVGKPSIGKGIRLLDSVKEKIQAEKLNYKIKMVGGENFVAPQDLASYYKRTKITIVPSFWEEPFGRTALESLACGAPVLATNRGGLPEIVEDKINGIICEAKADDFFENLKILVDDWQKYQVRIINNYDSLKEKFFTKPLEQYAGIYKGFFVETR